MATTASTLPNQPGVHCCDSDQWQPSLSPMDIHVFPCPAHTDTLLTFQQNSLPFENKNLLDWKVSFPPYIAKCMSSRKETKVLPMVNSSLGCGHSSLPVSVQPSRQNCLKLVAVSHLCKTSMIPDIRIAKILRNPVSEWRLAETLNRGVEGQAKQEGFPSHSGQHDWVQACGAWWWVSAQEFFCLKKWVFISAL